MKQEYIENIEKMIEECEDVTILDMVYRILKKTLLQVTSK